MTLIAAKAARPVITGMGMITPVGYSAPESAAAIRAGIAGFAELETFSVYLQEDDLEPTPTDPITAYAGVIPCLDENLPAADRCLQMAIQALRQAVRQAGLDRSTASRTTLFVAVPWATPCVVETFMQRLMGGLDFVPARVQCFATGHAAGLEALSQAIATLLKEDRSIGLVGGVDTYLAESTLHALHASRRLKHSKAMEGFIPGEAAAFACVESAASARERGRPPLARVMAVSLENEAIGLTSGQPCTGQGLAQAIREVLGEMLHTDRVELVVSDQNGEAGRAEEWAAAMPKCVRVCPQEIRLWHPADGVGDLGAAAGIVNLVAAAHGLERRATLRDEALVVASSEDSVRGAALLARVSSDGDKYAGHRSL